MIRPSVLVEHRVLLGIVEAVLVVGHDLAGVDPGAQRRIGLGIPDLAEERRAAVRLHGDHHPAPAVRIPVDRAAMGQHGLAGVDVAQVQQRLVGLDAAGGDQLGSAVPAAGAACSSSSRSASAPSGPRSNCCCDRRRARLQAGDTPRTTAGLLELLGVGRARGPRDKGLA